MIVCIYLVLKKPTFNFLYTWLKLDKFNTALDMLKFLIIGVSM